MINTFLDKTIEAAKQSALQLYDDDLSHLKNVMPSDQGDEESKDESHERNHQKEEQDGVVFERSTKTQDRENTNRPSESKLQSLRDYAAQQSNKMAEQNAEKELQDKEESTAKAAETISSSLYSRKDIRGKEAKKKENKAAPTGSLSAEEQQPTDQPANSISSIIPQQQTTDEAAVEKRLDRLESLMHLSLMSDDLDYSSHPAYHKLLHKGVSKKLVTQWFGEICQQGINPDRQQELVTTKLQLLLEELLTESKAETVSDILFFAGRSGTGKTRSVMRLCEHAKFGADKKVAIASIVPTETNQPYYTILEAYCTDKEIPYYKIDSPNQVEEFTEEWKTFDNILIDTPSMEMEEAGVAESIMGIKEKLMPHFSVETHYLVNTAVSGNAFNDPLATLIEADHMLLTHLDKSMKWGKSVQLMSQTDYKLRFISGGESMPKSLLPFNPKRFAEKLLQ